MSFDKIAIENSFGIVLIILFLLRIECAATEHSDLAEKVRQLKDQSAKSYVLKMNNAKFREYIQSPTKNYSFVVLFAAMASHRQCATCSLVHDEFELTAKSFRITHGGVSDRLFFGFVDYDQNEEIFHSMNINSVPIVIFFPAKRKLHMKIDVFDLQKQGYQAESMTKWLIEKSGIKFRVIRSSLFFGTASLLVLFFLGSIVIYLRCGILDNRTPWSIAAIAFCLLVTSGQIWNYIRGPPFFYRARNNEYAYVHYLSHSQFIAETYIILLVNACIVITTIIMIDNSYSDPYSRRNKVVPILCLLTIITLFSAIQFTFKAKAPNYPYGIVPSMNDVEKEKIKN